MTFFTKSQGRKKNKEGERAFAMLFSVLVASVLLSIGVSIFNLTIKELSLSSSGRESQFAFYSADTGAECALYWDFKGQYIFATSSDSANVTPSTTSPDCVDAIGTPQIINRTPSTTTSNSASTVFNLTIPNVDAQGNPAPYCAIVTVTKTSNAGIVTTVVDSRGYNTCVTTDPNRVERALRVTY